MAKSELGDLGVPSTSATSAEYCLGVSDALSELIKTLGRVAGLVDAGMSARLPTASDNPSIRMDIAHGNLSVVSAVLCGALIGQGILDAEDLLPSLQRMSAFWRERGCEYRALPAEFLAEVLVEMVKEKREVEAQVAAPIGALGSLLSGASSVGGRYASYQTLYGGNAPTSNTAA